jgi:hypothetical protein
VVVVGGSVGKDNERRGGLIHLMKTATFSTDNRDYPRSVMPDALCCSHRRLTMRELRLG